MMTKLMQAGLYCLVAGALVAATHNPFVYKLNLQERLATWTEAKAQLAQPPVVVVSYDREDGFDEPSRPDLSSSCKSDSLANASE